MLGRNPRHTRSVDDTTGGGSTSPLYLLEEVTDPSPGTTRRHFLLIVDPAKVHIDWYNRFSEQLRRDIGKDEVMSQYGSLPVSRHGRTLVLVGDLEDYDYLDFIRRVAEASLVPAPQLDFEVKQESGNTSTDTSRVFYKGSLSPNHQLSFPKVPDCVSLYHDPSSRVVIMTSSNPLYPVQPELVDEVKAALQANSVPKREQDADQPSGTPKPQFELKDMSQLLVDLPQFKQSY